MGNIRVKDWNIGHGLADSKIYKNWCENAPITEGDFIAGIEWLQADPAIEARNTHTGQNPLTRELGCCNRRGLVKLRRERADKVQNITTDEVTTLPDGMTTFVGFYEVDTNNLWTGKVSISADDVLLDDGRKPLRELSHRRSMTGLSRKEVCDDLEIPYRTLQDWELGNRTPPPYVIKMLISYYKSKPSQQQKHYSDKKGAKGL